jgi:calcineurin-like phosphoesterase family protein
MKTLNLNIKDQNIFFISDLHLQHENIIKYCNRPFNSVKEMNQTIINNWNNIVGEKDIIFILGDFCFRSSRTTWVYFLSKLNGIKYLIKGNHDRYKDIPFDKFEQVTELLNINIKKDLEIPERQRITLCHYPMLSWYQSHRGSWQLFGHIHTVPNNTGLETSYVQNKISSNQYDVGVDQNNFTPLSYQAVKSIITKQNLYNKNK